MISHRLRDTLILLFAGSIGTAVSLLWSSASLVDGIYHPMGADSFLHAARILPAIADLTSFTQWDTLSFAPQGAYNHWPWSYDLTLALVSRVLISVGIPVDAALMHIPTAWVWVNALLLMFICRQLDLARIYTCFALGAFFLSPLTQVAHGVGHIDHNFMELTSVLLVFLLMLMWSRQYGALGPAVALGLVLGLSNGVNITLFMLQIPVLVTLGLSWLRGTRFENRAMLGFALALMAATLAICAFSAPLQDGFFRHYYLSWFQVYVAAGTAITGLFLQRFPFSRRSLSILALLALVTLLPIAGELTAGTGYLATSDSQTLSQIEETRSPFSLQSNALLVWYSGFILLTPILFFFCSWRLVSEQKPESIALYAFGLFGLLILCVQYRFNHFGSFALYLLPFLLFQQLFGAKPLPSFLCGSATLLLLLPSVPFLALQRETGWNDIYAKTRPLYVHLDEICRREPGLVLTPLASGNYVRYHSDCSVLGTAMFGANNDQTRQGQRALDLLTGSMEETLNQPFEVDYILAVKSHGTRQNKPVYAQQFNGSGINRLLLAPDETVPERLRILMSIEYEENGQRAILARLVRVMPPSLSSPR